MIVATAFTLNLQPGMTAIVEFFDKDGKLLNTQLVTAEVVSSMPLIALLTDNLLKRQAAEEKEFKKQLKKMARRHRHSRC